MAARCEHDVLTVLKNNVLPNHVCTKPKGRPINSKPIDPDLLNRYLIEIGAADQPLFDTNRPYLVRYKLEREVARTMGKTDLQQFDEQLIVEAKEAERRQQAEIEAATMRW